MLLFDNYFFSVQCFISGSPTLQRLVFSADDIKGWRFLSNTQGNEKSFIYIMNTTDICFGAICSQECNLTIVSHEELSRNEVSPRNGTLKCRNQLQQCRMSGTGQVSFSVRGSCSSSLDFVRLAVIDNRAGVCGEDRPLCFNGKCFVVCFFGWIWHCTYELESQQHKLHCEWEKMSATWWECNDRRTNPFYLHYSTFQMFKLITPTNLEVKQQICIIRDSHLQHPFTPKNLLLIPIWRQILKLRHHLH